MGNIGTEWEGLGACDLEANTEFRHFAISQAKSAVMPFEVRVGMEGENTRVRLDKVP